MNKILVLLSASGLLTGPVHAQTTNYALSTGGAVWHLSGSWSGGVPSTSIEANVSVTAASGVTINPVSGTGVTISGLVMSNNLTTGNLVIRSYQSATSESQAIEFNKAAAGNVSITSNGSGPGTNTLRGRYVFTDSVDITATKPLTMSLDVGGTTATSGTGGINVLDGSVTITRIAADVMGARDLSVGDGTGSAGSASLTFQQTNVLGFSGFGTDNTFVIRPDGVLNVNHSTGAFLVGTDNTARNTVTLHGGGQLAFGGTAGTISLRNNGSTAVLKVDAVGSSAATIANSSGASTLALDLAATSGTGTRVINVAKNTATGQADLLISVGMTDNDDNMTYDKTGAGILRLTADNSSGLNGNGGWNIVAGGLQVANTTGSGTGASTMSVTIQDGASLGGTGTIAGSISFVAGAKFELNPLSIDSTSAYALKATGTSVSFANFGVDDILYLDASTALGTYLLIDGTGSNISFSNLTNINVASAMAISGSDNSAYFDFTNGDLALVVIPEPAHLASFASLAILGGVFVRRRRRS